MATAEMHKEKKRPEANHSRLQKLEERPRQKVSSKKNAFLIT